MKYRRSEAKDHARAHMKGIWAAALMPFNEDLSIDAPSFGFWTRCAAHEYRLAAAGQAVRDSPLYAPMLALILLGLVGATDLLPLTDAVNATGNAIVNGAKRLNPDTWGLGPVPW